MKLVKPSFEIIEQKPGLEGIYEMIEMAGRTCYKSERKEGTTAKDFVDRMIASGHGAMLEHGTVYLTIPNNEMYRDGSFTKRTYNIGFKRSENIYYVNNYIQSDSIGINYITTNYRYICENKLEYWLEFVSEPTEYHEKRYTIRFITDIGVGRELTRHRVFSFAQESTRYCNYSKDKFGNELTFIIPSWTEHLIPEVEKIVPSELTIKEAIFMKDCFNTEKDYLMLLEEGSKPEEARTVLSLATKSELVMTGFDSDWAKVFDLRVKGTTGKPHPDCKALVEPVMNEFIKNNWYGNNK